MRETFMHSAKWLVAAAAVSMVALAGCKKDEPAADKKEGDKPAAAGKEKPADKPAGEAGKTGEKPAEGKTEKAPAKKAPVALADKPVVEGGKGLWGLDMPADVIGFASTPSIDDLFKTVQGKAQTYGVPLPMTKEMILAKVQSETKLKSMDFLDTTKPIHVAMWNPKKSKGGVVLIPITGADKLAAALPDTKKENVDGNAFALEIDGEMAYINTIEGYAAVAPKKETFGEVKDFAGRLSKNHKPHGQLDVRVSAANLRTIFADELKGLEGQMAGLKGMLKAELEKDMPIPGMPGLDGVIDWYMEMAQTVLKETEAVTFRVRSGSSMGERSMSDRSCSPSSMGPRPLSGTNAVNSSPPHRHATPRFCWAHLLISPPTSERTRSPAAWP